MQGKKMFPKEKQFADLLDKQGRKWQYPSPRFKLKNTTYRPDFFLPNENLYVEVVGTRQAYHINKKKIAQFKKLYSNIRFILVDCKGNPFPSRDYQHYYGQEMIERSIRVSDEIYRKIKEIAKQEQRSIKTIVKIAVENHLKLKKVEV